MSDEHFYAENRVYAFYGVDGNCFKLDDKVFEAIEDESDGYRSLLKTIERRDAAGLIFQPFALDDVQVRAVERHAEYGKWDTKSFDGYQFVAKDGHVWLEVGTDEYDDYYPGFAFRYTPRGEDA
jgi:hypothetical protein